jgi:hypothetical protein
MWLLGEQPTGHSVGPPSTEGFSCAIGRHFNQDAIVWVGANAAPQLILLR